jgi:glucose-1-phosphate adenylyltransferase
MSILIRSKKRLKPEREMQNQAISFDMSKVATIILGGGEGTRLFPLTSTRCKPAISFGGKYRLIDIPLSNSINSKCLKIFVITQFLSTSLHQHISKTYHPGNYNTGFIELLSVEQKPKNKNWFLGTADAVRQNIEYFIDIPVEYFLILSGDQLYNMDFQKMVQFAKITNADLVLATIPVKENDAKRMGILKINDKNKIVDFLEKPQEKSILDSFKLQNKDDNEYLGSMGIYLFKRETLFKLLEIDSREDFGKHLIPRQVLNGNTYAYLYEGYWEDIGTIFSYYQANMALTDLNPKLKLYDENNPIFTTHQNLPSPKIFNTEISNSIISDGCIIEATSINHSILGYRTVVQKGTLIQDSYIIGNDYYISPIVQETHRSFQIGKNCIISKAIIDKHVHIGNNVQLINKNNLTTYNSDDIYIRDGIIIVTRGTSIPDGFIL